MRDMSNVIRFPVEERMRPTLDVMREHAPDVRMVEMAAEAFELTLPPLDFRHRVDAEAAEFILNNVQQEPGRARTEGLDGLLDPLVREAVQAGHAARRAAEDAGTAREQLDAARQEGGYWIAALEGRCETLDRRAAELLVEAHLRYEEAEGVARAVRLARSRQDWVPFNLSAEAEALFGFPVARQA